LAIGVVVVVVAVRGWAPAAPDANDAVEEVDEEVDEPSSVSSGPFCMTFFFFVWCWIGQDGARTCSVQERQMVVGALGPF
jgi:hypothetical protein